MYENFHDRLALLWINSAYRIFNLEGPVWLPAPREMVSFIWKNKLQKVSDLDEIFSKSFSERRLQFTLEGINKKPLNAWMRRWTV